MVEGNLDPIAMGIDWPQWRSLDAILRRMDLWQDDSAPAPWSSPQRALDLWKARPPAVDSWRRRHPSFAPHPSNQRPYSPTSFAPLSHDFPRSSPNLVPCPSFVPTTPIYRPRIARAVYIPARPPSLDFQSGSKPAQASFHVPDREGSTRPTQDPPTSLFSPGEPRAREPSDATSPAFPPHASYPRPPSPKDPISSEDLTRAMLDPPSPSECESRASFDPERHKPEFEKPPLFTQLEDAPGLITTFVAAKIKFTKNISYERDF